MAIWNCMTTDVCATEVMIRVRNRAVRLDKTNFFNIIQLGGHKADVHPHTL